MHEALFGSIDHSTMLITTGAISGIQHAWQTCRGFKRGRAPKFSSTNACVFGCVRGRRNGRIVHGWEVLATV